MIFSAARILLFLILCAMVVVSQVSYDGSIARSGVSRNLPPAAVIRSLDLGLHSAVASFLWVGVRSELPFLQRGAEYFLSGLKTINELSPRWSAPYVFSVIVLPNAYSYDDRIAAALEIGERGLANSDPDWRIPFYIGTIYQLELRDRQQAALHFDIAAATPGIPEIVRRFAINYGIHPDSLEATRQAWEIIYETSDDETVQARAAAHIVHLDALYYLNTGVRAFAEARGRYPIDLEEALAAGFLQSIPQSPFGFSFKIYEGGVVGIAPEE